MDILSVEVLEKFVNPHHLVTFTVIWFFVKKQVSGHFNSIEKSLETIGENIKALQLSLVTIEKSHSERIDDLSLRVGRLESET